MTDRNRALNALHTLDPGTNRETWLRIAIAAKAAGLTLDDFTDWSRNAANFGSDRECQAVWRRITEDGPVTEATLYSMANLIGRADPARTHHNGHSRRQTLSRAATPRLRENTPQPAHEAASALWARCDSATEQHSYIVSKRGIPDGLRVVRANDTATIAGHSIDGWLAVPVCSLTGELRTLQLIGPQATGKKLNMPGASFDDGLFIVGEIAHATRVFVVEGLGQAWACHQATACPALVCFGAGRMLAVSEAIRKQHPALSLVLVPDRGKETQAAETARCVGGEWVEFPANKPVNYDANDFSAEHGLDELAALLSETKGCERRYRVLGADDLLNAPPLRWLVRGVVPAQGLACIYGASGSGKSFLALDMCAAVAGGTEWFECRVTAAPVVYVALEGEHGFRQRADAWQAHHARDLPLGLRFVMQPFDLRNTADLNELADAVKSSGGAGGLLIIDTLNRASGGADENSSKDMGDILDATKMLQSQLGGTVLLIHHSGKDITRGLRGHSSLRRTGCCDRSNAQRRPARVAHCKKQRRLRQRRLFLPTTGGPNRHGRTWRPRCILRGRT